jgi:hypothetical protein
VRSVSGGAARLRVTVTVHGAQSPAAPQADSEALSGTTARALPVAPYSAPAARAGAQRPLKAQAEGPSALSQAPSRSTVTSPAPPPPSLSEARDARPHQRDTGVEWKQRLRR